MVLLKNHRHQQSLLSALFVQPCHSLADPPLAVWIDGQGQYADPGCPLTVHAGNNRGPCVLQVASHATNQPRYWPESANAITQHKPDTLSQGYGGRQIIGCDKSGVCYSALPIEDLEGTDWYNKRQPARWIWHKGKAAREMVVIRITSSAGKGSI